MAPTPPDWPRTERAPAGETTTEDLIGLVQGVRDQQQRAIRDRPPPTGYRDEQERWHPGPGGAGYIGHIASCLLPLGVATVVALALLVAVVTGARVWGADRVPTVRRLRR